MNNINDLQNAVADAQNNLLKAEQNLQIAQENFQSAMLDKNIDFFDRWNAWISKRNYKDISNVEAYFQPPYTWTQVKKLVMQQKGLKSHEGGRWNWAGELSHFIAENKFVNLKGISDSAMIQGLECIMEYDCIIHCEDAEWDM